MDEIGRPVDRIDDPEVVALGVADAARFFGQNGMVRIGIAKLVDDGFFGRAVGGGDEIVGGFVFNAKKIPIVGGAGDFSRGAAGGLDGGGNESFE